MTIVIERTIMRAPPLGLTKLSELEIDVSKDWGGNRIENVGAPTANTHVSRAKTEDILSGVFELSRIPLAVASDTLRHSNDAEASTAENDYTELKRIKYDGHPGKIRVRFDLRSSKEDEEAGARIYKNWTAYGTQRSTTGASWQTYTEDLQFSPGDTIQLHAKIALLGEGARVRNFRLYFDPGAQSIVNELE